MESVRIDAVSSRCLKCAARFEDRHRVIPAYFAGALIYAVQKYDVGLFVEGVRPMWRHVDCADVSLKGFSMLPDIHKCIRCKRVLGKNDVVSPVFQVTDPRAVNPKDFTDVGMAFGDRVHFIHAECGDQTLTGTSPLLVT